MKKNIFVMLIIIISLIILIIGVLFLAVYFNKEKYIKYECSKTFEEENNIQLTMISGLTALSNGIVYEVNTKYIYTYKTEEEYKNAKIYYQTLDDMEYSFNDKNYVISAVSNTNDYSSYDSDNNKIETWYKTYLISMNNLGYSCKEK